MKFKKLFFIFFVIIIFLILIFVFSRTFIRYSVSNEMIIPVTEFTVEEYPDNPSELHEKINYYSHPEIKLTRNNSNRFTIELLSKREDSASIFIKDIDISLMTPSLPSWVRGIESLTRISLTDRQWNRQQVEFEDNVEIIGGDGFEKANIDKVELAKNCLNAGLWEIVLSKEGKHLYHGWFTFPLGHYKNIFEDNTKLSYWRHWYYLEHWFDPEGIKIDLTELRTVLLEKEVGFEDKRKDKAIAKGEQISKSKNINAEIVNTFEDYFNKPIQFSTFLPPGIYVKSKPWVNEYQRLKNPKKAIFREINSANDKIFQEIEIVYSINEKETEHFFISGFDLKSLPISNTENYNEGTLFLMGIATPPLKQKYSNLVENKPEESPIFSFHLTKDGKWINHHDMAVDGSILFRDENFKRILHIYLVSYERHAVIAHYVLDLSTLEK